jgi:hypothetical protein
MLEAHILLLDPTKHGSNLLSRYPVEKNAYVRAYAWGRGARGHFFYGE